MLLDSFEGTLAGDVKSHLEYVREIRDAGGTTGAQARAVQGDALAQAVAELESHLRAASGKPGMDAIPNGYARGLVLAKFPVVSGVCRHVYQRLPVRLSRAMRPVLGDGSLGAPTDTVDLGWTEGAILVDPE